MDLEFLSGLVFLSYVRANHTNLLLVVNRYVFSTVVEGE